MANAAVRIAILADAGPAKKALDDMASSTSRSVGAAGKSIDGLGNKLDSANGKAPRFRKSMDEIGESTDETATKTGILSSAMGAFAGGLEAVGLGKYAPLLEGAAIGTDVLSNASDVATLALQSARVQKLKDMAATAAHAVTSRVAGAASKVFAAGQWLVNAAMAANPIGLVVLAIAALVTGLIIAYKKSETFRKIVDGAFAAVKKAVSGVVTFFTKLAPSIFRAVGDTSKTLLAKGKNLIFGVINGYNAIISRVAGFFRGLPGKIATWIGNTASTLKAKGENLLIGLSQGINARVSSVVSFFTGLPGKIVGWLTGLGTSLLNSKGGQVITGLVNGYNAKITGVVTFFTGLAGKIGGWVGNLGSTLVGAGKEVINGLISGVTSKITELKNKLGAITQLIKDNKGPIDKDRKLLTPAGKAIMTGLMKGMDAQLPALTRFLNGVSADIESGLSASPSVALRGAGSAGTARAAASPAPVINVYALTDGPDVGRSVVNAIGEYERFNGTSWRK